MPSTSDFADMVRKNLPNGWQVVAEDVTTPHAVLSLAGDGGHTATIEVSDWEIATATVDPAGTRRPKDRPSNYTGMDRLKMFALSKLRPAITKAMGT